VKIFLDSSVLVPVFLADHPQHAASIALFSTCNPDHASCAAHSLAEVYATLTRLPAPHRATAEQALLCIQEIARRLQLIALDGRSYLDLVETAAKQGIVGGLLYDALIAKCAIDSCCDRIFTWNQRHFELLGEEVASRLAEPAR
jgi:predicted nucleic acid-binding protein